MTAGRVLPVVLLCGGLGLRQRTDLDDLPKALRPLPDGRPLLLHVLDYYRSYGLNEFVLCVGYQAAAVREAVRQAFEVPAGCVTTGDRWVRFSTADVRITLIDSGVWARKCRRLLDARRHVGARRFLLGYADVLSDLNLDELVRSHVNGGALLTLTATRVRSRYGIVTIGQGTLVDAFEEKPVQQDLISAGYFVAEPAVFDELAPDISLESEVLPGLAVRGRLHAFRHDGLWVTLDTYKDFVEVESLIDREGAAWLARI